tara:strand:+ start:814 stop:1491 length:678 start_codon:yes stop_codon:yes gene_type:complete
MKLKISSILVTLAMLSGAQIAYASDKETVDLIRNIQVEGLSLKSTAEEINAFISSKPSWQCQHLNSPARENKSKHPRPPSPSVQNWTCTYTHQSIFENLHISIIGGVTVRFNYEIAYSDEASFDKMAAYIKSLSKDFKATDRKATDRFDKAFTKNFAIYMEDDGFGSSVSSFRQTLDIKTLPQCDGVPIYFKANLSTYKIPSQNAYRAGIKIERSNNPLHCTNLE